MFYTLSMNAKSFEGLLVWQKAHAFVLDIYRVTRAFPKSELFALTPQMRRAAISIPANIAEGFKNVFGPTNTHTKDRARITRRVTILPYSCPGSALCRHFVPSR
jgi:hypothetical protein